MPVRPTASFMNFAKTTSRASGSPLAFIMAVVIVIIWAATGPIFDFSDTWQLVINTGTTIITFLMVFLIQSTQNRDTEALQLKLDEVIRALESAQNSLIDLENMDQEDIDRIKKKYARLAEKSRSEIVEETVIKTRTKVE